MTTSGVSPGAGRKGTSLTAASPTATNNKNADVLAQTAKARQSEQGALKRGGIDLLVMPPKLKGRLPLWRAYSVEPLRRSVERRN